MWNVMQLKLFILKDRSIYPYSMLSKTHQNRIFDVLLKKNNKKLIQNNYVVNI